MPDEIAHWLGQQWVALLVAFLYALTQVNKAIDESEKLAERFGEWGREKHERARKKHLIPVVDPAAISTAVEAARALWESEENSALRALDERVGQITELSQEQSRDIGELRFQVRALTAYTTYEARWHHRAEVAASMKPECDMPAWLDYFSFEPLFRADPNFWRDL